jgi:hypothetical protein
MKHGTHVQTVDSKTLTETEIDGGGASHFRERRLGTLPQPKTLTTRSADRLAV